MRKLLLMALLGINVAANKVAADEPGEQTSDWYQPKLPAIKITTREDWYPLEARMRDIQGRVLLAFDLTPAGVAKNISVLWAENEVFSKSAIRMLSSVHFAVPADWVVTTGLWRRWRVGIVYRLASPAPPGGIQSDEFAIPAGKLYITGSSMRKEIHTHQ